MLAEKHKFVTLASELDTVARPFLTRINANYFQYLRVFRDGSFALLVSRPDWCAFTIDYMCQHEKPAVYSHINAELLDKRTYYFLWEPNLPSEPVELARQFNIANGLTFVERFEDYYNMIAFATPSDYTGAMDTYLNCLSEMHRFTKQFEQEHANLIQEAIDTKLLLPEKHHDVNLNKMLYESTKGHLTPQEHTCLIYLSKGYSYKEIAFELKISPRTVESYLNRIRKRFGLHYKKELINLLDR